jgi:anti-sigma B factor antagonist
MNDFSVDVVSAGQETTICAVGQLDVASAGVLQEAMASIMAPAGSLIVDLSQLTFIDSAGLSSLVAGRRAAALVGCRFTVRGAQGAVADVLEQTGIGAMLRNAHEPPGISRN